MLQELTDESENQGLKMNKSETKVMMKNDSSIYVNNTQIENVERHIYMGQRYSTRDKTKTRRFKEESRPDGQHSPSTATSSRVILGQVYNSCVLPAMTHGAKTWALTTQAKNKLAGAQTKMERSMLNITYRDRKINTWVREQTKPQT